MKIRKMIHQAYGIIIPVGLTFILLLLAIQVKRIDTLQGRVHYIPTPVPTATRILERNATMDVVEQQDPDTSILAEKVDQVEDTQHDFARDQSLRWKRLDERLQAQDDILSSLERVLRLEPSSELLYVPLGYGVATWYTDSEDTTGATKNSAKCYDPITREAISERVNEEQFASTMPRWLLHEVGYCANLLICRIGSNRCVQAVGVDARGKDGETVDYLDLWPAAAEALNFGPSFGDLDVGVIDIVWYLGR